MKYILPILIFFCSCSTTSKVKSSSKVSIDSSSVVKIDSSSIKSIDSVSVKKDNTVTTVEKEDNYVKETTIEYEPVTPTVTSKDYFPIIKKTTIKETGIKKEKQTVVADTYDSLKLVTTNEVDVKKETATDLHKTISTKDKQVERTSYWGWLWFLLIPVVWVGGWYFGLWPLIPKRRKKEEYPVKYEDYNPPKPPAFPKDRNTNKMDTV